MRSVGTGCRQARRSCSKAREIAEAAGLKDLRLTGGPVIVSPLHQPAGFNATELGLGIMGY